MNRLVSQQIKQLAKNIEKLRDALSSTGEQLDSVTKARDELQRKTWTQARELALLRGGLDDVGRMRDENETLRTAVAEVKMRLRSVQGQVRGLETHLRP